MKQTSGKKTALLIMDVYQATVPLLKKAEAYLASLSSALKKARANQIPVIYVVLRFRNGYPEISASSKMFAGIKDNPALKFDSEESMKVHPAITPVEGDITVIKKRVGAFTGSDLEVLLRSLEIKHIVLTGISTSGGVLSTLCEAADKDYAITVLSDCCADMEEEVHRILLTKIFIRKADVVTWAEWSIQ